MSSHEPLQSYRATTQSSNRVFGLVFAALFLLVALWPWLTRGEMSRLWALGPSVVFLCLAVFAENRLAPLNRLWFKIGLALHAIVAPALMGVLFFGAVTPLGCLMRLLGHNLLGLKKRQQDSYWIERDAPAPAGGSMKNQF
jgi:hypothetical protein